MASATPYFATLLQIAGGLCVVAVVLLVVQTAIGYRRLSHIPGPPLASVSQLWLLINTSKGDLYLTTREVLRKYGSPARIGPNLIITDDPELIRAANAPRSRFRRGPWYEGMKLDPRIDNLLSEGDEQRHAELRAKMLHGYTGKEVPGMESELDDRVLDLINLIRREGVDKSGLIDFAKFAQYFTMDSLTQLAFGYPFGFLTKNEDLYDYHKSSTAFFPVLELGANVPFVGAILRSRLMQLLAGPKSEDKAGLGAIIGIAQKVVSKRFEPDEAAKGYAPKDMLNSFIEHGLTQLEAESESLLQILAGSDSTATTIRLTMLQLLTNPPAYARLRAEIDAAVRSHSISAPVITNAEAQRLPHLQACIRESIRVCQPLTGLADKLAPPEGVTTSNGVFIPGGTRVAVNSTAMCTRSDIFGPDSDLFRPGRWTDETDAEKVKAYERIWEMSFASGRFTCPGRNIAMMECGKVFVELLRRFDFGLANPTHPMDSKSHQLFIQNNMMLQVWPRKADES